MDQNRYNDTRSFENALRNMGINPANIGKKSEELPALPGSDEQSLQGNRYNNFYGVKARDFWQHSEIASEKVEEWKKCEHYITKQNNEAICTTCHVGWTVPESFYTQDGKLYDGDTLLSV